MLNKFIYTIKAYYNEIVPLADVIELENRKFILELKLVMKTKDTNKMSPRSSLAIFCQLISDSSNVLLNSLNNG